MDEEVFTFGSFRLVRAQRTLSEDGRPLRLGSRAFDILAALTERAGETISKEELIARAWPDTVVEEAALRVHVAALRKALGDGRAGKRYIANFSGRGYAFIATVTRENAPSAPVAPNGTADGGNLSTPLTRIVGRDEIIAALSTRLARRRFLTIVGPGGIGKTTVAVALADRVRESYKDGARFVGLASLSDPDLVPSAVGTALGVPLPGGDHTRALAAWLRDKQILIVLDNCEHVIGATAVVAEAILKAAPQAGILATAREPLRAEGEWLHRLAPLELPPQGRTFPTAAVALGYSAVELFNERATATIDSFVLNDADVPAVLEICRRLDGVPLALELAAARVDTIGVAQLAALLDDRFAVLTSGRRTALPRQQTLRATIDWSYNLLSETEQLLLRHLAVFPAGFTVDAAAAVIKHTIPEPLAVEEGIANLIAKSLIALRSETDSRWYLLETIRSYALEKLIERGEHSAAAQGHAEYFRDFLTSTVADFRLQVTAKDLIRCGREIDNVRAALDWCFSPSGEVSIGIDLTVAYAPVWLNLSLVVECRERCEHALRRLDANQRSNARLQMRVKVALGAALLQTLGPSHEAETMLSDALAIADASGDLSAQAHVLFVLSSVQVYRGEHARAQHGVERIRQIAQQIGDPYIVGTADRRMGIALMSLGRLGEARRSLERVTQSPFLRDADRLPLWRQAGDRAMARASLARVLWLQGFAERAHHEAQLSCDEAKGSQDQLAIFRALYYGLGRIAPMTGDFVAAEDAIAQLFELASSLNAPFWVTAGQFLHGKLLVERGEFAEGLIQLRQGFGTCEKTGWRLSYPEFMGSFALAFAGLGRLGEADDAVSRAIAGAGGREDGQQWYVPELLRIKAEVLLRRSADQSGCAEDYLEQAATMAHEQGALSWELRVALSLARLCMTQGRHNEAKQTLAPVCDRFTEGFATTDLRAAKALLDTF